MKSFDFKLPTRIIFGLGSELKTGSIIKEAGFKRVIIHYGQGQAVKTGLLDSVKKTLGENGIIYKELGGVQPNPEVEMVIKLRQIAREFSADMILAIGGGSVIDSAKMAALSYYYEGNPFDISLQKHVPKKSLPVGVILTIAAAGSEMSGSAVITDPITKTKVGVFSELNRPLFCIMNPALTYSVSKYQTAVGIVDMMMHTLERYFAHSDPLEFSDYLSEGMLKSIMEAGLVAFNQPDDYHSRSTLMMASSWAHNGLTSLGKTFNFPVHQIEHAVSGLYPSVAHGAGLAVLFPAWAEVYCQLDVEKFNRFATNVMNCHLENKTENAKMGVLKLKEYFKQLGMPLTLRELGIENPDIDWLVGKVTKNGTRAVDHFVQPLDAGLLKTILKSCR